MSEHDRHPLPPEVLADALQDRVHVEMPRHRPALIAARPVGFVRVVASPPAGDEEGMAG